ncbi:hypothetical protein M427DRAFT_452561 [Gonapodya prolifera JEL478]|uniref:C2 domain-containing protein n=1 Tax=Gonapodya prolifera (strain JEL478) TaxID=1344416 RepID=A0A139ARZ8_GONPJ|nr:hypothetical protein M427DRAFT_452561 [Gonapodya prolifera JEL478]|eukprot:KXS19531.1 hypothetical protein M427DRAFT_452561 [Gonapodya prolifera JEL478]
MATLKDGASSSSPGTKTLARTSAASNGANVGVIPPLSYETRDFPMEPSLPFGLEIFLGFREEYERAGLVLGGLLLAYFLGFWRLGWIWVFIIGAAGAGVWKRTRDAQYRRVRAQVKRELAAEKLATKYSDLEAAEWFNLLLARFWLIYEPSLSETLTNVIDGVLEWATPSFLQSLKLTTFTLGSQGPRIECVKSFPHEEQDVVQWLLHITFTPLSTDDIKIARNDRARRNVLRVSGASSAGRDANKLYGDNPPGPAAPVDSLADFPSINAAALAAGSAAGLKPAPRAQMEGDGLGYDPKNSQVVLTARMGKGLVTVPVAVEVKDVELDLQVIVRLKLIPSFPHIGSVTIMLPPYAPPPFLNFGLSALNVEVFNIPGLAEWIRSMVVGGIQSFLGGEGYTLDLASMMTATGIYGFDETVGVLVFNIFEARRLKNVDVLGGKSDPYARILIGANSQPIAGAKTQIIDNDLNPAWNEVVYVLVPASAFKDIESGADLLRVEVMDHNDAGKDASLGVTRTLKLSRWLKLLVEHELARRKPQQPEIEAKPVDGGLEDHDDSHMDNEDQTQGEKAHERELKDLKFQLPDVVLRGNDLTEAERALMMEDWGGPWGGDDVWAKLFEPGSMRPTVSDIRMEVQYLPLTKRSAVAGDQTAGNIQGMAQSSSGVLRVQLQQLKDLDGTRSLVGVLNPYVKIKFAGQDEVVHTSKIKKRTNNPIFTETFEVFVPDISTSSLIFQVWDSRDLVTDLVLGEAKVSIPEALRRKASDDWYTVSNIGGSSRSTQTSTAKARLAFSFFPVTLGENQEMAEEGGGVVKGRKPMGVARVTVKNAVKLKNAEPVGLSDPYVALSLSGKLLHRTKVIDNNLNPIWDQTYHLIIYSSNDRIEFQIFDYNDLRKDKSMGRVEMPLLALFPDLKTRSRTVSPGRDSADGPSPPTSPTASVDNFLDVANAKLATSTVLERDGIKLARSISEFGESVLINAVVPQKRQYWRQHSRRTQL